MTLSRSLFRHTFRLAAALALAACTIVARADCVDGVRESTAAERDYEQRAVAALAALIPATPENMALRGKPFDFKALPPPRASLCKSDRPDRGWEVAVGTGYLFTWPKADQERRFAERRQLLDQIAALEALPPEQTAKYQQLNEQSRAAYNSQPKKARRSDPELSEADKKLAEQKAAEGKSFDEQAKAIMSAHLAKSKAQTDPIRVKADVLQARVQELHLILKMNTRRLESDRPTDVVASAGNPGSDGELKANNIVVIVSDRASIPTSLNLPQQTLFGAVDQARMRALLGKPLPAVSESEASARR